MVKITKNMKNRENANFEPQNTSPTNLRKDIMRSNDSQLECLDNQQKASNGIGNTALAVDR